MCRCVEPAFFLEEGEEDEATEEFLGEVADGFVRLGLSFWEGLGGNGEAGAAVGSARWGEQLGEEGGVVLLVFCEELLGQFLDGEGFFDIGEGDISAFSDDFCEPTGSGAARFISSEKESEAPGRGFEGGDREGVLVEGSLFRGVGEPPVAGFLLMEDGKDGGCSGFVDEV